MSAAPAEEKKGKEMPHLGVLEEDDEFEEFQVEGTSCRHNAVSLQYIDWGANEEDREDVHQWDDNWDDDDIGDDFSQQLRSVSLL